MSLVNFRRRLPWSNMLTTDFSDTRDFLDDEMWLNKMDEPALNILEKEDVFEIELAAPGFDKKDFEVTIANSCLNVAAKKSETKEESEGNYTRKEFSYNSFTKSLQLPESVIDEDVKAKYENGVLTFSIAKNEEYKKLQPKEVKIS